MSSIKLLCWDKPYVISNEVNEEGFITKGYIVECKKIMKIPKILTIFAPIVIFVMRVFYDYVEVEKENK